MEQHISLCPIYQAASAFVVVTAEPSRGLFFPDTKCLKITTKSLISKFD